MVRHEHIRTSEGNRIVFGYKGSHILLKENDIPQNERIGALIPPNSGLSQQIFNNIGRKGYAIPFPSRVSLNEHSIILAHTWQVEAYKMFLMDYDIIAGNGTVTVMRRKIN
jgi:hypothetical protein